MPFLYCSLGFVGIWFIFDLADNLQDFIQGNASASALIYYYSTQIPEIVVISLPLARGFPNMVCFKDVHSR